jgi:hypothetical protein
MMDLYDKALYYNVTLAICWFFRYDDTGQPSDVSLLLYHVSTICHVCDIRKSIESIQIID